MCDKGGVVKSIDHQYLVISVKAEQAKQVTATGDGVEPMQVDPTHQSTTTPESASIDSQQVSMDLELCVFMHGWLCVDLHVSVHVQCSL